jgi:hypothetical protein
MILRAASLPAVRAVPIWICDQRFWLWQRRHPGSTFADFYVADAEKKLRKGTHRSTLGARGWETRGSCEIEWNSSCFAGRGLVSWRQIVALGLEPDMRCVDFGCGSLRIGQHAMRYLGPSNYWGVDLTDSFIHAGLRLLPPDLVTSKKPRFGVVGDSLLAEIRDWAPEFIFANAVVPHIPPDELPLLFSRISSMMVPSTRACIVFAPSDGVRRTGPVSWAYPPAFLEEHAKAAVPGAVTHIVAGPQSSEVDFEGARMVLCIDSAVSRPTPAPEPSQA